MVLANLRLHPPFQFSLQLLEGPLIFSQHGVHLSLQRCGDATSSMVDRFHQVVTTQVVLLKIEQITYHILPLEYSVTLKEKKKTSHKLLLFDILSQLLVSLNELDFYANARDGKNGSPKDIITVPLEYFADLRYQKYSLPRRAFGNVVTCNRAYVWIRVSVRTQDCGHWPGGWSVVATDSMASRADSMAIRQLLLSLRCLMLKYCLLYNKLLPFTVLSTKKITTRRWLPK